VRPAWVNTRRTKGPPWCALALVCRHRLSEAIVVVEQWQKVMEASRALRRFLRTAEMRQ
jgi:hypothetical protein